MDRDQKNIELIRKYASQINTSFHIYVKGEIPSTKLDNAINKFASGVDRDSILALYDTSLTNNGKTGYIFTDSKIYYSSYGKGIKIWYDEIETVQEQYNGTYFTMNDGSTHFFAEALVKSAPLVKYVKEMMNNTNNESGDKVGVNYRSTGEDAGALAGGFSTAAYKQVNKSYDEEKFHGEQGHGFAAERANNLVDQLTGHDAQIVGDNNIKNGPDRIVDGIMIQSKYCHTGKACIDECFKDGAFRYMYDGKPMQIEVPSDKYDVAVQAMEEKIRQGKIPGVTDPGEARNIVRKGHFTYEQAKNIAKAGTVEAISYDAVNGTIIATTAFGITATITLAVNMWNGEDFNKSLKLATYSGLKVGGTAFITTIIAGQLSKAGLNSALVGSSEAIVTFMGPKASAVLINAFRNGSNIYGAAAMKSAAKLLRGNAITAGVTALVLSAPDVINIFRGRISGKQMFKNAANTVATVGGGTAGWLGGATVGTAILPGIGTAVGALAGSIIVGSGSGKLTDKALGAFIEDDAEEMVRIIQKAFEELASDYLLSQKEAEKSVDELGKVLNGKKMKDMFASKDRKQYARDILIPIIENETQKRKHIRAISEAEMVKSLREVLEDISETEEYQNIIVPT